MRLYFNGQYYYGLINPRRLLKELLGYYKNTIFSCFDYAEYIPYECMACLLVLNPDTLDEDNNTSVLSFCLCIHKYNLLVNEYNYLSKLA